MIAQTRAAHAAFADRLRAVRIYLITDARPLVAPLESFLERCIEAGVGMVQLRDSELSDGALLAAASRCAKVCHRTGALFILNDRVDVALLSGADGVHVGQDDLPVSSVRALTGPDFIVGLSTHSQAQIAHAQTQPVDYIGVGPIHETPTKPGRPAVGLELVRHAAGNSSVPFFAIGGLNPTNVREAIEAGASRISVLRCVTQAADPGEAVRALLANFG